MSDHSNSSYPTAAGRGWIPGSRDIGLPGESFPRGRGGRPAEGDPGSCRDDGEGLGGAAGPGASASPGARERFGEREGDSPRISCPSPAGGGDLALDRTSQGADLSPRNAWTAERKVRFLHRLAEKGDVRSACAGVGLSRQSAYVLRRRDALFALGWDAALVLARRHVEEVLAVRALDGVEEAVFYHGEQVAVRRRFDARLLLAHLARLDRAAAETAAGAHADRFDEVLALVAGEVPEELVLLGGEEESAGLPPERSRYVAELGAAMAAAEREAWLDAVDAGEEAGDGPAPDPEACRAVAAGEWDAWQGRAAARVDGVLAGASAPMEFKSANGAGLSCAGPCQLCQPDGAAGARKNIGVRELYAGGGVSMGEGRRGASPTPLRYRVGLTFFQIRQDGRSAVFEDGEFDFAGAGARDADLVGGGLAEVDQAVRVEWAAVVDGDDHRLAVGGIGDADLRAERQGAMRGGEAGRVETLAAGGAVAGEFAAVEAGHAGTDGLELRLFGLDGVGKRRSGDRRGRYRCDGQGDHGGRRLDGRNRLGAGQRDQPAFGDGRRGRSCDERRGRQSEADALCESLRRLVLLPRHRQGLLQAVRRDGHPCKSGPSHFGNGPPDVVKTLKGFGRPNPGGLTWSRAGRAGAGAGRSA